MAVRLMAEAVNQNPTLALLTWQEEVVYRRLFLAADNYGNFPADPAAIKARCFPHQHNRIGRADILSALAALERAALAVTYTAEGGLYVHIYNHGQQPKARPRYPLPPQGIQPKPQQPPQQGAHPQQGKLPQPQPKTPPQGAQRAPRRQAWRQQPPPPKNYDL